MTQIRIPVSGGVPTGGTTNQALIKKSNTNYDVGWSTVTGGGGGEANTSSNAGASGAGLAKAKIGVDLPFKRIIAGANVTITDGTDAITIASTGAGGGGGGEANTMSSAGGTSLVLAKVGVDLPIKGLIAGANITLTPSGAAITVSSSGGFTGGDVPNPVKIWRSAGASTLIGDTPVFKIVDTTGTSYRTFQVYGDESLVQIGPTPRASQWQTGATPAPAGSSGPELGLDTGYAGVHLFNGPSGGDSIAMFIGNASTDGSEIAYAAQPAGTRGLSQQADIGYVGANSRGKIRMHTLQARSDGGFLLHYNQYNRGTGGGVGRADPNRFTAKLGWDSGSIFGWGYKQPADMPASAFDSSGDFGLVVAMGGWTEGGYVDAGGPWGQYTSIGTKNINRGLQLGTSSTIANGVFKTALQIEPWSGSTAGTVTAKGYFYANYGARVDGRLHLPAAGTDTASLSFGAGAGPTTPQDGFVWFDGTNIYIRVAGVTKTFTLT